MLLSSYLEQYGLAISQSPGDGHCLLHAVTDSWHPQTNQPRLNLEQVKQHLLSQTLTETDKYLPFFPSPSREALIYGVRTYLKYKRYNQDFGDFVPRLLADSLKTKIVVLDERPDKHCIKHEFIPGVSPDHTIILHRKQDHYNALVPFKLPVSSVSPSSALSDTRMPKSVQKPTLLYNRTTSCTKGILDHVSLINRNDDMRSLDQGHLPKSEACTLTSPSLHRVACRRPLQHLQYHGFPEVLQKQTTNVNSIQYDRDTLLKLSLSEQSTLTRKLRKFLLRSGLWYNVKNASNTRNVTDIHNIATVPSSISVCITSYVNRRMSMSSHSVRKDNLINVIRSGKVTTMKMSEFKPMNYLCSAIVKSPGQPENESNLSASTCFKPMPIQVEINKRFSDKLSPSTRFRGVNHNNLIRPNLSISCNHGKMLQLGLLNARSVRNKSLSTADLIIDRKLDILAITETWLKGDITDNVIVGELVPSGYSILSVPRTDRVGGGVALIFRKI